MVFSVYLTSAAIATIACYVLLCLGLTSGALICGGVILAVVISRGVGAIVIDDASATHSSAP